MIPSAELPIDPSAISLKYSLIMSPDLIVIEPSRSWLVTYQSAFGNADAALLMIYIPQPNPTQPNPRPYLT
jgi:hypothetical protein